MKKLIFVALAVAAAAACSGNKTVLCGTVPADSQAQVELQVRGAGIDTLITPVDGKFSIDLPVDKMESGFVAFGEQYSQFILDGSKIVVNFGGDGEWVRPESVKGANAALSDMMEWNEDFMERYYAAEGQGDLMKEYTDKMKELTKNDNALGMIGLQSLVGQLKTKPKSVKKLSSPDKLFLAIDGVEFGRGNKIPLWLFGFLY